MTAKQHQATLANPNNLNLTEVTRYQRTICANKERVWENVIDWQHLPHLHNTSFSYAELDDAGDWGWRIWSDQEHRSHVELCYDMPNNRYVARSYKGIQQVSEIWTTVTPTDQTTDIEVQFLVPDVPQEKVASVGKFFQQLYSKLWDEDEAMMIERQAQLDKQSELHPLKIDLGYEDELLTSLPRYIDLKRGRYRVIAVDGQLKVHSVVCPHILGPLNSEVIDNKITCPWHGYQFDLDTGACVSPANASCRLSKAPQISVSKEPRPRVQVGFTGAF
ncbi:MAG: nitrite reductase/ring-hydroxylating ferredoxin subunit [Candidatus Azotimanducaceae bacterium]|jgi:nitrite reductase/ring-hydroxylating ferredoxin subunit